MGVVVEETDETVLWFELLAEGKVVSAALLADLMEEGRELLAIFAASYKTARARDRRSSINK